MTEQQRHNLFSELLTCHQSELYGYIYAVVRNWQDADDLYQSVCLVLWRKFESFRPGSSFLAWARQTARIEVSKHLRLKHSSSSISETLLDEMAETAFETTSGEAEPYLTALRHCKAKLADSDEELLELHYVEDLGSRQIADRLRRSQSSVCNSLNRIRSWLLQCIQMELARLKRSGEE
jgi:RNA polymerase sigma-70 factor, ECF subfamily